MPINEKPDTTSMAVMLAYCQSSQWESLRNAVLQNPSLAVGELHMRNKLTTFILHQAISARGNISARARLIDTILQLAPQAAAFPNGYNSLPLHVLTQRNVNIDSATKERLIVALIHAYPQALVQRGGLRERTPLHIAFTDYISPKVVKLMIKLGPAATSMRDKEGWLPIHVACSRHASPEKLALLLKANPSSLHATTGTGQTLLSLAQTTATKAHPNRLLIDYLSKAMKGSKTSMVPALCHEEATKSAASLPLATIHTNKKNAKKNKSTDDAKLLLHFKNSGSKVHVLHY